MSLHADTQVSPPEDAAADLLSNVRHRTSLCSALLRCYAFDRAAAPLLLHSAGAEGGGSYGGAVLTLMDPASPPAEGQQDAAEGGDELPHSGTDDGPVVMSAAENGTAGSAASVTESVDTAEAGAAGDGTPPRAGAMAGASAVLLPRLPAGLLYVATPRAYEALARIPRSLGRLAAAADTANRGEELSAETL